MNVMQQQKVSTPPRSAQGSPARPVVSGKEVAHLLGYASADRFYRKRPELESHGFPQKLPGMNGWSRAAILRWIDDPGGSTPIVVANDRPNALEGLYA